MNVTPHRLIVAAWVAVLLLWVLGALTAKRALKRQSAGSRLVQTVLTLAAYFLIFDPDSRVGFLGWRFIARSRTISWICLAITLAGLIFAVWARLFIGRNWSSGVTVKQDHQLMRTGPYAIVRHPIYAGLLLALLGTAIEIGEVRGLVGVALATIAWRAKWTIEERFMTEQFGAEYTSYKREVKALLPFVW